MENSPSPKGIIAYREAQLVFGVLAFTLLATFIHILFAILGESSSSPTNQTLSTFSGTTAQILAGIFAITFTITTLALAIASDRYTPFLLRFYAESNLTKVTMGVYFFGILYTLIGIAIPLFSIQLNFIFIISIVFGCFYLLVRLFQHTVNYLDPSQLILQIEADLEKITQINNYATRRIEAIGDIAVKANARNESRIARECAEALKRISPYIEVETTSDEILDNNGFFVLLQQYSRLVESSLASKQDDTLSTTLKILLDHLNTFANQDSQFQFNEIIQVCYRSYLLLLNDKHLFRIDLTMALILLLSSLNQDFQNNKKQIRTLCNLLCEISKASNEKKDSEQRERVFFDLYQEFSSVFSIAIQDAPDPLHAILEKTPLNETQQENRRIVEIIRTAVWNEGEYIKQLIEEEDNLQERTFRTFLTIITTFKSAPSQNTHSSATSFLRESLRVLIDINQQILKLDCSKLWSLQLKVFSTDLRSSSFLYSRMPRGIATASTDYLKFWLQPSLHSTSNGQENFIERFRKAVELAARKDDHSSLQRFNLDKILSPIPSEIRLAIYREELEKQHNFIRQNLPEEQQSYFDKLTKAIEEALGDIESQSLIFQTFFYIGALAVYFKRYNYIKRMWRYTDPHDADANWIATNLVQLDKSVLTAQLLQELQQRSKIIEDHHGSNRYVIRYYFLTLAYALNYTPRNSRKHIQHFRFPESDQQQLERRSSLYKSLFWQQKTEYNDLHLNIRLFKDEYLYLRENVKDIQSLLDNNAASWLDSAKKQVEDIASVSFESI